MTDIVERLRARKASWLEAIPVMEEAADEIERLRLALQTLVDSVLDYERVNNLSPNPGRKYCWDSVEHAINVLKKDSAE